MGYSITADWLDENFYADYYDVNPTEGVCIHHSAGTQLNVKHTFEVNGTSAHYSIKDHDVIQYVEDRHGCWHAGSWWANNHLLSIECVNSGGASQGWPVSEETVDTLCELLADKCREHGFGSLTVGVNLFGHRDFYATACPGVLYDRFYEIADRVNKLLRGETEEEKAARIEAERVAGLPDSLKKYVDLWPNDWYIEPVREAVERGIMRGVGENVFAPNSELTRAQAVAVIANYDGADIDTIPFDDIAPWYAEACIWAEGRGVVHGNDGNMRPNDPCTRAEFLCMLHNYLHNPEAPLLGLGADWQDAALSWARSVGVLGEQVRPDDPCTRAEAAAFICRL